MFAVLDGPTGAAGEGDGDAHRDIGPGWVGWFGYASRPDLPARLDKRADVPEACWLRADGWSCSTTRVVRCRGIGDGPWRDEVAALVAATPTAAADHASERGEVVATLDPGGYAEAFVRVQSELRRGNSYETNLTYRTEVASGWTR